MGFHEANFGYTGRMMQMSKAQLSSFHVTLSWRTSQARACVRQEIILFIL